MSKLQRAAKSAAKIQLPVALVLLALVIANRLLGLGLSTEAVIALAIGAGSLGIPRLSEVGAEKTR